MNKFTTPPTSPRALRASLRLSFFSLVLLAVLIAPAGAQAVGMAQELLSPTPTQTPDGTASAPASSAPDPVSINIIGTARWNSSPSDSGLLATGNSYALLAGKLINNGMVDATTYCDGGLRAVIQRQRQSLR